MIINEILSTQKYKESIKSSREDNSSLEAVIILLEHTSELVSLFNDRLYITSTNDARLQKLNKFVLDVLIGRKHTR